MPVLIAAALFAIPGLTLLILHVRLDDHRTSAGEAARRGVGRLQSWREQLRATNYRPEGRKLLRWYLAITILLQVSLIADLVLLVLAYP